MAVMDISAEKLRVFGDESFDGKRERVAAVAVLVGTTGQWDSLVSKWTERTNGKEFHANTCETEYANDPDIEKHRANLALYRDLTILLADSKLRGFGVSCDLVSARKVFPHWDAEVGYYKCFVHALNACGDLAVSERKQIEEFILHNRRGREYNVGLIYQYYMERPEWKSDNIFCTQKLSFDTAQNPRIQAADLMARESMKFLDGVVGPIRRVRRGALNKLANTKSRFQFVCYEGPYFQDMRDKMAELEKSNGMSREEMVKWLQENKLADNWSNRMHFLIWFSAKEKLQ